MNRSTSSLRSRLLVRLVVATAVPTLVLGAVLAWRLVELRDQAQVRVEEARIGLARDVVAQNLESRAVDVVHTIDRFLGERLEDVRDWTAAPILADLLLSIEDEPPIATGTIDAVEARFMDGRTRAQVTTGPAAAYVERVVAGSEHVVEAFLTDARGYNVVTSNQTSDFVQSDEGWWQSAWETGTNVGEIEFDASAGVFSMDMSVRIDDPVTRRPLGVVKSVVSVTVVQAIADQVAAELDQSHVVVAAADGRLVADTSSGHDPTLIMMDDVVIQGLEAADDLPMGEQPVVSRVAVSLASASARATDEDPLIPGWRVLVWQPSAVALGALDPVESLAIDIGDTVGALIGFTGLLALLASATGVVFAVRSSRSLNRPIADLADAADELAGGNLNTPIDATRDDELGDIARSLQSLAWLGKYVTNESGARARGDTLVAAVARNPDEPSA